MPRHTRRRHVPHDDDDHPEYDGKYIWQGLHGLKNAASAVWQEVPQSPQEGSPYEYAQMAVSPFTAPIAAAGKYVYDGFKCPGCKEMHYCGKLPYAALAECGLREQNMGPFTVVYCKWCKTSIGTYANVSGQ